MKSRKGIVSPKYDVGWFFERLMNMLAKRRMKKFDGRGERI
jgi:hypothetical protein